MKQFVLLLAAPLLLSSPEPAPGLLPAVEAQPPTTTPGKRALIVAVSQYPATSGWLPLGSGNDAELVGEALRQQHFAAADIQVLSDSLATRAGVVAALQGLAARTQPGDVVVVHFSGHGQQVQDDNGDESDGLDEALVPYDAPHEFAAGHYAGQRHLRDDQLGELLGAIRQRAGRGGEVLAIIDACHSGTGTRALSHTRGTDQVLASPTYRPAPRATGACVENCLFGLGEGRQAASATWAPLVSYFATSPGQSNYEVVDARGRPVGPLSLAFAQSLTAGGKQTYGGLFDRIRNEMAATAASQTPQMEGPPTGQVFGGRTVAVAAHFRVLAWPDDQTVLLEGGLLHGLGPGTEVALYPPDTLPGPGRQPLATGRLTKAGPSRATVALNQPLAGPKPPAWALVTAYSFNELALRLQFDLPAGPLADSLQAAVRRYPVVRLVREAPWDLSLAASPKTRTLVLLNQRGQRLYSGAYPAAAPAATVRAVLARALLAARAKYLRGVTAPTPDVAVALSLVPVTAKRRAGYWVADQFLVPESKRDAAGHLVYAIGEYMQLRVKNTGRKTAYFTVLDVQPSDTTKVLLPRPWEDATEYVLDPGDSHLVPRLFCVTAPVGEETLKLIATDAPFDLRPLITSQGAERSQLTGTPLAAQLASLYPVLATAQSQNRAFETLPVEIIYIGSLNYFITNTHHTN